MFELIRIFNFLRTARRNVIIMNDSILLFIEIDRIFITQVFLANQPERIRYIYDFMLSTIYIRRFSVTECEIFPEPSKFNVYTLNSLRTQFHI